MLKVILVFVTVACLKFLVWNVTVPDDGISKWKPRLQQSIHWNPANLQYAYCTIWYCSLRLELCSNPNDLTLLSLDLIWNWGKCFVTYCTWTCQHWLLMQMKISLSPSQVSLISLFLNFIQNKLFFCKMGIPKLHSILSRWGLTNCLKRLTTMSVWRNLKFCLIKLNLQ